MSRSLKITIGLSILGIACAVIRIQSILIASMLERKNQTRLMRIEPIHVWRWIGSRLIWNVVGCGLRHVFSVEANTDCDYKHYVNKLYS